MLLIVVSIPRRMLLKITRTPRTEVYKNVITNRCDQTFVYFLLGIHANYGHATINTRLICLFQV